MKIDNNYNQFVDKYRSEQNKFDYFFLALILGTLAVSINTFNTNVDYKSIYLMIFTWFFLIISLLAGIFRQEKLLKHLFIQITRLKIPKKAKLANNFIQKYKKRLNMHILYINGCSF